MKRYTGCEDDRGCYCSITEDPEGNYVKYEDALRERTELLKALKELYDCCNCRDDYTDTAKLGASILLNKYKGSL